MKIELEMFHDPSYYGMWCVRNKQDKSFNNTIHVMNKESAEHAVTLIEEWLKSILAENYTEETSLINMQQIAIEKQAEEIAQLRKHLAAYEAQPAVQICQLTPGKWTHLIERPHSTTQPSKEDYEHAARDVAVGKQMINHNEGETK